MVGWGRWGRTPRSGAPRARSSRRAGPDASLPGAQSVTLDGTGSADDDGDPLNYLWTQAAGPAVTLSNPLSAAPSFDAAAGETYTFQLVVDDCLNASAPDAVVVTVAAPPPTGGGGGGGHGCGLTGLEAALLLGAAALRRGRRSPA